MPRLTPRSRPLRVCTALTATALLGGCALFDGNACHEPQPYQQARSVPPLKVPEGLAAPATRTALRIPEGEPTARPRGPGDPCLDEPPSFYPDRPKPGRQPAASAAAPPAPAAAAPATGGATPASPSGRE